MLIHHFAAGYYGTLDGIVACTNQTVTVYKWSTPYKSHRVSLPEYSSEFRKVTCSKCLDALIAKVQKKIDILEFKKQEYKRFKDFNASELK